MVNDPNNKMVSSNSLENPNPYEWVGLYHNEIVNYVRVNYNRPYYSGIWPDHNFIATTLNYVQIGIDSLYPQAPDSIEIGSLLLFNSMNNHLQLLSNFRSTINNSTTLTQQDKLYSLAILTLSEELLDSLYDFPIALSKINNLENEILNQDWDLEEEGLALFSISLYKHSYQYWNSIYEPNSKVKSYKDLIAKPVDRGRIAANGVADYVIGAATFLSATGASGGLGAAAGLWAGVKAGVGASAAVDWAGSLLGWW